MMLVWAQNVVQKTNKPVLIVAPLAVSSQTAREGEKFGIECRVSRDGTVNGKIVITNYERLHYFNPEDFAGVCADEIQGIKAFDGKRRKQVTRFMSKMQYRLGCTATPAPNDFIEIGTISEALGELTQSDMLSLFFKSSDNKRHSLFKEGDFWNRAKYFFRPHGEVPFWRWMCTWARALRKPSDIGNFDDKPFILPELKVTQHVVEKDMIFPGELFHRIATTLKEQRIERKFTMRERCEKVAELVDHNEPAVVWCQYNDEGDLLEKLIPGCVQVAGCNTDDDKEQRLTDFTLGRVRVLVTKPKCASLGMNWQHCGHQTWFASHSFEQVFQGLRRSLRFGRVGPVRADFVTTKGEEGVTGNLAKKERKADQMFESLVLEMRNASGVTVEDRHVNAMEAPSWL